MIMQITGSSAIAAINFGSDNAVSVQFTSKDTAYDFVALDATALKQEIETTVTKGESVGKLIAARRRDGSLKEVVVQAS